MGAGKSTVGAMLAKTLGWEFLDADTAIEAVAGKTVAEIFAQHGEEAFRSLEAEAVLKNMLRGNLVLALGGGALETESTRRILASAAQTCVIFLDAPLDVLVERCLAQPYAAERPVLADRDGLLRRFNSRLPHYRSAQHTISTKGLSPEAVVARILDVLAGGCISDSATKGATV